ncbi:MAG: Na/Pi symporter, partial [Oscillospiraceae bacterium]
LSLTGIQSSSVLVNLMKPENFSPIIALVGIMLIMISKKQKRRDIGRIMVGFAILMYGMELMKNAVSPLADMPEFSSLLTAFENPLLGVLVGAVFTGIIQSSAASVGILQALALTGSISVGMAIPVIMGQNIGTCVTAILSSFGVNRNAKRVAAVHISFNIIGTVICLILFYGANAIFHFSFTDGPINAVGVAFCHTVFNVFTTLILLPFARQLEKLATCMVKDGASKETDVLLDNRLLRTPGFAIAESANVAAKMAQLTRDNVRLSMAQLSDYQVPRETTILAIEEKLDAYEDRLGNYLVEASRKGLSSADSRSSSKLLHSIGDFERIGDHALNIMQAAQELHQKGLTFSNAALTELDILTRALDEILDTAVRAFETDDLTLATSVEPLEEVIDQLIEEVKVRHIARLQSGQCTIQLGFILSDLLTNYERISDHCSNLAICVIEMEHSGLNPHEYLHDIKGGLNKDFTAAFGVYLEKYALPVLPKP